MPEVHLYDNQIFASRQAKELSVFDTCLCLRTIQFGSVAARYHSRKNRVLCPHGMILSLGNG